MELGFTGERIVPGAPDCEPTFAQKMYQEHVARYAFAAQFADAADVLDVGCGVGYGSQWLANAGAKSVLGFDLSEAAIDHARMHYFHPAVSYRVQDAATMDFGQSYDLVTCFELIEHIAQQERVLDKMKGSLRDQGRLVISTPRPLSQVRTHFHVHEMKFEELRGMLARRFRYVESFFEVNCFGSYIGQHQPDRIDHVVPVSDRIGMAHADYFIFVASDEPITQKQQIQPLLSLNDDAYVLTLEKDVGVLRNAENSHLVRIADLQRERDGLAASQGSEAERNNKIVAIHQETSAMRLAVEQLNRDISLQAAQTVEAGSLRLRIATLEASLAAAGAPQPERVEALEAERNSKIVAIHQETSAMRLAVEQLNRDISLQAAQSVETGSLQSRIVTLEASLAAAPRQDRIEALEAELRRGRDAAAKEQDGLRATLAETAQRLSQIQSQAYQDVAAKTIETEAIKRALGEAEQRRDELSRELDAVRRALAEQSERTAAAQTESYAFRASADRLPEALDRASKLETEINALRYRFDQTEATLSRFRGSFSWAITRPLRAIWRAYRKMTGRSLP